MAEPRERIGDRRRETASLLAHALVRRLTSQTRRPDPAQLRPTIYLALRRGEDPSWRDVVARSV